jgi:hypothetical protein
MKLAIALVAASVFIIAPVLAQNNTLSGGGSSKNPPTTSGPSGENADKEKTDKTEKTEKLEKTEKSTENTESSEKATGRHHRTAARHHRHGTTPTAKKVSKSRTSMAMYRKRHGTRTTKEIKSYAKYETHHPPHGHTHVYGRSTKHKPSVD